MIRPFSMQDVVPRYTVPKFTILLAFAIINFCFLYTEERVLPILRQQQQHSKSVRDNQQRKLMIMKHIIT